MAKIVLGVFPDRGDVEDALEKFKEKGYDPRDISIVMKDTSGGDRVIHEDASGQGSDVVAGTVSGISAGAVIGGLAGLLAAFAIPGLGAFFIGGPIASALGLGGAAATTATGAITGAAAGGLIGALTSMFGLSHEEAQVYEEHINRGAILVAVPTMNDNVSYVTGIFEGYGASDVKTLDEPRESASRRTQNRMHADEDVDEATDYEEDRRPVHV